MGSELIRDKKQLEGIADSMSEEVKNLQGNVVSRYIRLFYDVATFLNGQKSEHRYARSNTNREIMDEGLYTQTDVDDLLPHNFDEVAVARDLQDHRFNLSSKKIPLPTTIETHVETVPDNFEKYDNELREFTKEHQNARLTRTLTVEQRIIVNSKGGIAIQSLPFLEISYSHGYAPIPTSRDLTIVCSTPEDVTRLPTLIEYLADPTPEGKIKNAKTFGDAFHELHSISGLKYGSLEEAGIPLSELYDVVMLTGVPVHEIFGHHFEEPIRFLNFGESGTFKFDQNIQNRNLILRDNPKQTINGFRVQGFTNFDAYGRKREERIHIKDGKVAGFLGGEYADPEKLKQYLNLDRSPFYGSSVQYNDGNFPQPRMSCTVIDGKTESVDLEGKILIVSHEGHTRPQDKTYMVKAFECYVVREGVPRRVIPLQVTGGINQALANMILMDDVSYQTGFCGKPEPIYYPQSHGSAQAPVSQFAKSQMWQGQQVYPLPISDIHLKILQKEKSGK